MVICLERDADLQMAQLTPLPLTVSCFSKIQIGFTFLLLAHPGSPGKGAVKRVCVCVYCCRHKSEKYESCSVPMERGAGGCGSGRRARLPDTDFCVLLCFSGEEVGVSDRALHFFR